MTVVAHAGHWLTGLIYVAPVALVVLALFWQSRRDRGDPERGKRLDDEDDRTLDDVMDGPT